MHDNGMDDVSGIGDYEYLSAVDHSNEAEPESRYLDGITADNVFENNFEENIPKLSQLGFCFLFISLELFFYLDSGLM